MQARVLHLFILAALAWLVPLAGLHQKPVSPTPSIPWCRAVWDVAVAPGETDEVPLLAEEEEEEDRSEVEREPAGFSFVAARPITSSWSDLPAPCFASEGVRLVASATPRGPPSSAL